MHRRRAHPDPVSCQSCRSKKLKCDRVQPCANCSARGISCKYLVPPQERAGTATPLHSIPELIGRIERLESIVLQQDPIEASSEHTSDSHHTRQPDFTSTANNVVSDLHRAWDKESQSLENIGTRENSLLPRLSSSLTVRISNTFEVLQGQPSTQIPTSAPDTYWTSNNDTVVTFPVYRVAVLLFESYESRVNHMCRILHTPTVRSLIKTFYSRLSQREPVPLGQAALLLSLFALSAFFYHPFQGSEVATTEQEAVSLSKSLSKGALDVLDHSRRITSGALEDIQAYILMSFVTFHLDGFSARGRILSTAAASIARDLRLHRLDAADEQTAENEPSVRVLIDREIKRRVFWHIATSDWLYATISGPQEGMYFIHPNHMKVNLPRDCLDDDIIMGEGDETFVGPRPNGVTFFLERVRLAHLCREMVDIVPLETSKLMEMPYERIIALDQKLEAFISSLPFFLSLDSESRMRSKRLETLYPHIPVMRCAITNAAYSRRCKLHQRFLLRQSLDLRYAYSRKACLEAARTVIRAYEDIPGHESPSYATARMGMAIHYTHLALVVMVMDLCFNRDEVDEAEIKADVRTALKKFQDNRGVSLLPGRFLRSLCDILRKHRVYLAVPQTLTSNGGEFTYETRLGEVGGLVDQVQSAEYGADVQGSDVAVDPSFDEFWQFVVESEPNLDSTPWDNMFSALDSRPL
ncbi:hypothetical protein F4818DRAFT_441679 [Hypoxylon cercidicola]|nr:hypothetical protein F4818DRAFT_441679 [Hypoxylon cercidicola]